MNATMVQQQMNGVFYVVRADVIQLVIYKSAHLKVRLRREYFMCDIWTVIVPVLKPAAWRRLVESVID
jgi:hypothetical protein